MRRPSEILVPETAREAGHLMARLQATGATLTFWDPAAFALRRAVGDLCAHFGLTSLAPFGVSDMTVGLQAAGAALAYVRATQGEALGHRSEEHTSELQSHSDLVCRLLLEKKKKRKQRTNTPRNTK